MKRFVTDGVILFPSMAQECSPSCFPFPDRCRGRTTVHSSFFQLIWVLKPSGTSGWWWDGVVVMVIGEGGGLRRFLLHSACKKSKTDTGKS